MSAPMMEVEAKMIRVLEFYSGIGGMHFALKESGISAKTVGAVDINDIANKIYRHNFPGTNLMQRSIEGITLKQFIKFEADMLLMSPPCQPFTRQGLQADSQDARTKSFFYVMDMLPRLPKSPTYLLIENVKGFETSDTRNYLVKILDQCNYNYEEFLISPVHLGIPNQRLRYFLLAKKRPLKFVPEFYLAEDHILQDHLVQCQEDNTTPNKKPKLEGSAKRLPAINDLGANTDDISSRTESRQNELADGQIDVVKSGGSQIETNSQNQPEKELQSSEPSPSTLHACSNNEKAAITSKSVPERTSKQFVLNMKLRDCLEDLGDVELTKYLLQDKVLMRYGRLMDIVTSDDERTMCFTKGYGHKAEGTGSVLQVNTHAKRAEAFSCIPQDKKADFPDSVLKQLRSLKLRYFTPREIARLHYLPEDFSFPADISVKQCYRVLGNSLNAYVVSVLLQYLLSEASVGVKE